MNFRGVICWLRGYHDLEPYQSTEKLQACRVCGKDRFDGGDILQYGHVNMRVVVKHEGKVMHDSTVTKPIRTVHYKDYLVNRVTGEVKEE